MTDLLLWIDAGHFDDSQSDRHDRLAEVLHRWPSQEMIFVESSYSQTVQFYGTVVLRRDRCRDGREQKANDRQGHSRSLLPFVHRMKASEESRGSDRISSGWARVANEQ